MQLVVGRIAKAHGIGGEVAVDVRTDDVEHRFAAGASLDTDPAERGPLVVDASRWHSGRLLVRFKGVPDRTAAEGLRNTLLVADSSTSLAPEDSDEFWDHDLIGLAAQLADGAALGEITDVLHPPGPDLLVVRRPDGGEVLVPFVAEIVPTVDIRGGRVVVNPPAGLLVVMRIDIVTIFPEYFGPLDVSLLGKARERGLVEVAIHDLRDETDDVHRTVDDSPYGGGPGMLMRPEPWGRTLDRILANPPAGGTDPPLLVIPTPSGRRFVQSDARAWSNEPWLIIACGRYEGIDARVALDAATRMRVEEVSIGDYVLAGGEVAALVIIEAVARLMPGFMGNADSPVDDSFTDAGRLEAPAYTRPAEWRGLEVPSVLTSGDHAAVARWRAEESRRRTEQRRPDLA